MQEPEGVVEANVGEGGEDGRVPDDGAKVYHAVLLLGFGFRPLRIRFVYEMKIFTIRGGKIGSIFSRLRGDLNMNWKFASLICLIFDSNLS